MANVSFSAPVVNDLSSFPTAPATAGPHYAHGIGGFLERLIPAGTSILGSVLGSLAGPVGTVGGGAVGGDIGQFLENKLTGQKGSVGQYLEQGALGGLTGIGKGITAIKGAVDVGRAGGDAGAVGAALKGSVGSATGGIGAAAGRTIPGATSEGLSKIGNKVLTTQVNGLKGRLLDTAPLTMQHMAEYGVPRVSQFENLASKVTGKDGVLNTVKNQIIQRAEKNGAAVNLENFGPTKLASVRQAGGRFSDTFNPNLAGSDTVSNAIKEHLVTDPAQQNAIYRLGKGVSQSLSDAKGAPTAVFAQQKRLEGLAQGAFGAGKTEMGNSLRSVANDLGNRLDTAVGKEAVTPQDTQNMINGLIDNGVTNPKLLQDVKGLAGKAVPDIRSIESRFVNASHIGAATRRANLAGEAGDINKGPIQALGNTLITRPALGIGRQVVGRGSNMLGNLVGKAATAAPDEGALAGAEAVAKQAAKTQLALRAPGAAIATATQGMQAQQPQTGDATQAGLQTPGSPEANALLDGGANAPTASQTDQGSAYPLESMMADVQNDPSKASTYLDLYKALNPGGGALSSTEQSNVDNLRSAASSLQTYMQQVQAAGQVGPGKAQAESALAGVPILNKLVGQQGADIRGIEATRVDMASQLAKALTGSSRPAASVIQQWAASIPNVTDTPEVAQQKYQNLIEQIQNRLQVASTPATAGESVSQLLGGG